MEIPPQPTEKRRAMDNPTKNLKKFDLVRGPRFQLGVIISDPFTANFFDSRTASTDVEIPFDIANPASYNYEVADMVLVYVYVPDFRGVEAVSLKNLWLANIDIFDSTFLFDHATCTLRERLSVKKYAESFGEQAHDPSKR